MHKDIEVVCSPRDRLRSARNALRFPHVERKESRDRAGLLQRFRLVGWFRSRSEYAGLT